MYGAPVPAATDNTRSAPATPWRTQVPPSNPAPRAPIKFDFDGAHKAGFITGAKRNKTTIRAKAQEVADSITGPLGVSPSVIAGQFEGVSNRREAITPSDWLMKQIPYAAAALARVFSDEEIQKIWKHKG
jgi:hypothetical protein